MSKKNKNFFATVIASVAGIGILLASAFNSPEEVINDDLNENKVIVKSEIKNKQKQSFVDRIPLFLRAIIGVPLWILGNLLIKLIDKLAKLTLMPFLKFLLMWFLLFLVILLIIVLCIKILFPEIPFRKIINKKLIINVAIGTFIISVVNIVMPLIWKEYVDYKYTVTFILGLVLIILNILPFIKEKSKINSIVYDEINDYE